LGLACISYYVSELFHWSGIISLIGCGIVQAHYSFINITKNSLITIEYFTKMASSTMDSVIFLYLGMNLLGWGNYSQWCVHGPFVAWTLFFCLAVRFLCVFLFSLFLNRVLVKKLNLKEQFIMAYGGLRGAVGFSLVISIQRAVIPSLDMLISTTLIVVMFTIWLQGGTIKLLVNLLGIDKETDKERCLLEELNDSAFVNLSQGLNNIIGDYGWVYLVHKFDDFDETYLKNIFSKPDREHEMKKLYEEIVMAEHAENMYQPRLGLGRMEFVNEGFHMDEITEISKDGLCQDVNENSVVAPAPAPYSRRVSEMSMRSNPSASPLSRRTSDMSIMSNQSGSSYVSGSSRSVRVALCDRKISGEDQEAPSDELSHVLKRELRRRRSTVTQQAESMRRLSQCVPERRMSSVNANIDRQRRISLQEIQEKVRRASTGETPNPALLALNNTHHNSQDHLEKRKRKTSVGHQIHLQQVLERVNSEAAAMSEMEREAKEAKLLQVQTGQEPAEK